LLKHPRGFGAQEFIASEVRLTGCLSCGPDTLSSHMTKIGSCHCLLSGTVEALAAGRLTEQRTDVII